MSELKDDTIAKIHKTAEIEKLKAETAEKRVLLDSKTVDARLKSAIQNEKEIELAKKASYGALSKEEVKEIVRDNDDYMESAQKPMMFICSSFNEIVPFFRKNMILVAAKTGEGKSTAVANIAYSCLIGKDPTTGKTLRTLVITNEEKREDFYNRITSLIKGWHYTNHSKFTKEQRAEFSRMIPILASSGRLTVIDNNHGGSHGVTTSIDGIEALFNSLLENKEYYNVVLIDYYQNIISSKLNPTIDQYKIQERFARLVDNFKNNYPAPIVVMSQLRSQSEKDKDTPFQIRIMGSKSILVPCTFAVEMVVDRKNLRTQWIVHKSRYTEGMGKKFWTGYEKGKFIEYNTAFAEKVQRMQYEREANKANQIINQNNGIKDVFNKKEEK
jgi:hypothetical protein